MDPDDPIYQAMAKSAAKQRIPAKLPEPSELAPDAPAPALELLVFNEGRNTAQEALNAWNMRLMGHPIVDIAHNMGVSIEGAKFLIKEAHRAIAEDLKENLEQNRQLDLGRIDGLIRAFYPVAIEGEEKAGHLVLKCLERRAKLTGTEPEAIPTNTNPQNVLVWIQAQMPRINKIVDALPEEEPPGAPS